MEEKIIVAGDKFKKEIIGESLHDCVDTVYRNYKGTYVKIFLVKEIGYIDGDDLFVLDQYLDRYSIDQIKISGGCDE